MGYFPRTWKKGMVIFFRKRNKDPRTAKGYRPITLLCIRGKILERVIKIRTITILEANNFMDDVQYEFREGRSTITVVFKLKEIVRSLLRQNIYCAMLSIDIQGAFDSTDWNILSNLIDLLPMPDYLKSVL